MKSVAQGKPYAEQPHARFEKGASGRAEPRRCALLHRSNKIRFFVRIFALVLVFLYSVKPSAAFLTSVISTCFIGCDVESSSLYRFFGSAVTGFSLVIGSAFAMTGVVGCMIMARKKFLVCLSCFLMVLLFPFQFMDVSVAGNMCFSGVDEVSVYKGWVAGKEIPSEPNNLIMAVKQKGIGYRPYAIFNGFDIDGYSMEQVGDVYVVKIWLKKDARIRLARILSKQISIGYLVIHNREMYYADDVEAGIQRSGMYFSFCDKSEDVVDDVMFSSALAPISSVCAAKSSDKVEETAYRGRILDLDSFIKRREIQDRGSMTIPREVGSGGTDPGVREGQTLVIRSM